MKLRMIGATALVAAGLAGCGGGGSSVTPTATFAVGGNVSNLTGAGLSLVLNGSETLSLPAAATTFLFTTQVAAGSTFGVTIRSQPANQSCGLDSGGGVMPSTNVTITVTCSNLAGFNIAGLSDPLAVQQWHLKNTGQSAFADVGGTVGMDINVEPAFGLGFTGLGVTIAVVDTGLEIAHEDLAANVIPGQSWNFNNSTTDPTSTDTTGDHGTSVAGLIAMAKNSVGGIGVAPSARLKGFNLLSSASPTETQFLDSIGASSSAPNSSDVAIFNQSFGLPTIVPLLVDPSDESQYAAATVGPGALRGGKGAIYVKAGGNGFFQATGPNNAVVDCTVLNLGLSCENANFDPDNTLPYQIVVAAMNANGVRADYSTAGSALWASAPGGEFGENNSVSHHTGVAVQAAMVTTDQSSCTKGFSVTTAATSTFDRGGAPNASCNYTNTFNGTSSATPVTSGVVALMLEANPALTWRDVKHIIASTARKIDASGGIVNVPLTSGTYSAEPGWLNNNASPIPFHYHNWYGFGLIDAAAAVNMAKTYSVNLGTFTNTGFISSATALNLAIPDASAVGVTSSISVPAGTVQFVEAVQIRVNITHPSDGDLAVEVSSPSGMRSVVKNFGDGYGSAANLTNQVFLSNAFYGENPAGTWTIKVVDGLAVDTGHLNNWAIRVYGH